MPSEQIDSWRAGQCRACGGAHFPLRGRCPRCWSNEIDGRTVDEPGRLETFTVVHRAIGDRAVPYAVGWATFPECRVRIFGVVQADTGLIQVGDPVTFVPRRGDEPPYVLRISMPATSEDVLVQAP